jgi:hypothetical protein
VDGIAPDCETEAGCCIPALDEAGARIIAVHEKLRSLGELVGRGEILRMYGVTIADLELLELVERESVPPAAPGADSTGTTDG